MARGNTNVTVNADKVTVADTERDYSTRTEPSERIETKDLVERYREAFNIESKNDKELDRARKAMAKQRIQEEKNQRKQVIDDLHKIELANQEELLGNLSKASSILNSVFSGLTSAVNESVNSYISKQEAINAHLVGTSADFSDIADTLDSVLGSTSIVKQSAVYDNLSKLVNAGIVSNVEQRAFLETLSDDMGMVFSATDGTLTRMIRLLGDDISANSLALEYSLQEFLNQNYQTSEYIKDAFENVASQLIESQSLMGTSNALSYSSTVQAWMGSLYSAGASSSTVSSLAKALDQLSSGDTSSLGTGIANLILMGVANAGLDYGSLLENNLTDEDVNTIMSYVVDYMASMGDNNNVVMSQMAKLFGISVSDIAAAQNVGSVNGTVSTNVGVLSDIASLISTGQRYSNAYNNSLYTIGTNIASNDNAYLAYMISNVMSDVGSAVDSIGSALGELNPVGIAMRTAGTGLQLAPLITILGEMLTTGSLSDIFSSGGTSDVLSILSSLNTSSALGSTVRISGSDVSTSMYVGNYGSTGDIASSMNNSNNDTLSAIGVSGDTSSEDNYLQTIDSNVAAIYNEIYEARKDIEEMMNMGLKVIEQS